MGREPHTDRDERKARRRAAQEETFQRYRTCLQRELARHGNLIALYRRLNELYAQGNEILKMMPGSFSTIDDALFTAIVVSVDRLLGEPRRDEWNLHSFLGFIAANAWIVSSQELQRRTGGPATHGLIAQARDAEITRETVALDRERLRAIPSLKHFREWRDRREAHLDRRYLLGRRRLEEAAPLVWGDLTDVYAIPKDIFNRYSAAFDGNAHMVASINVADVEHVLSLAKRGHRAVLRGDPDPDPVRGAQTRRSM